MKNLTILDLGENPVMTAQPTQKFDFTLEILSKINLTDFNG